MIFAVITRRQHIFPCIKENFLSTFIGFYNRNLSLCVTCRQLTSGHFTVHVTGFIGGYIVYYISVELKLICEYEQAVCAVLENGVSVGGAEVPGQGMCEYFVMCVFLDFLTGVF